jgi:predicted DsbA family dithiol-disulfide isomerase
MSDAITVHVVGDFICPWCHLGEARLAQAIASLPELELRVERWPFELNPHMPAGGMPRLDYRVAKFGSLEASRALDARLSATAAADGVAIAFDRITVTPNTRRAHMLARRAGLAGVGELVAKRLYAAYFEEGIDIGDRGWLAELARSVGLPEVAADEAALEGEVVALERAAEAQGISGVPFFVIGANGYSGALPAAELAHAIRSAA